MICTVLLFSPIVTTLHLVVQLFGLGHTQASPIRLTASHCAIISPC
jgi:hypothetical protein